MTEPSELIREWISANSYTTYLGGGKGRRVLNGGADLNELLEIERLSSAPTPEMENRCACGRLDLGKYDGLGSTDPKDVRRGSHSRSQCYDMQQRRLQSSSAPKEPDNANL